MSGSPATTSAAFCITERQRSSGSSSSSSIWSWHRSRRWSSYQEVALSSCHQEQACNASAGPAHCTGLSQPLQQQLQSRLQPGCGPSHQHAKQPAQLVHHGCQAALAGSTHIISPYAPPPSSPSHLPPRPVKLPQPKLALCLLAVLLCLASWAGTGHAVVPPLYYCSTAAATTGLCSLCNTQDACSALPASQFVDGFQSDGRYCSLPRQPSTAAIPNTFNSSVVCPNSRGGSGVSTFSLVGSDPSLPPATVGTATVFLTTARRLYLSLQFSCAFMFNTEPGFQRQRVSVGVWTDPAVRWPAYVDVLYAPGFYTCYTLSVDLANVCDASRQANFTASPNDPSQANCACPNNAPCPTLDLTQSPQLYLSVTVWLAAFQQASPTNTTCARGQVRSYTLSSGSSAGTVAFPMPDCLSPTAPHPPPPMSPPTTLRPTSLSSLPPPAPPPALFSPPLPATRQVTLTFRTSASVEAAACTALTQSFAFLLLGVSYQPPIQCLGPLPLQTQPSGSLLTITITFLLQSAANDFVDSLAPPSAASSAMKLLINSVLRSGQCNTSVIILGRSAPRAFITLPDSPTASPSPPPGTAAWLVQIGVDTSRSPPLADPDCQSLLFLMQTAVRAAGATSASPATCSVSSPSAVDGSTAASVRAALTSQAAAFRLFNVLMSPSVLASIVMPLQLPCQGTFIIISQPGTPGTTPTVFDQRAFPAQSNCGSPSPPPQPPGEDPYYTP
ncbi:hypothetical protein V8C86DRAFT_461054 [Haematococcus lacustris]